MDVEMDIIDSQKNNNFINYHLEESSIHQIKKRNEFYGDLIDLNESTNENQIKKKEEKRRKKKKEEKRKKKKEKRKKERK